MSNIKTTVILSCTLGILVLLIVLSHLLEPKADMSTYKVTGSIFPDLVVDGITEIEMKKGDDVLTLVRDSGNWTIAQQFGYKADMTKVEALLNALRRYNDADIHSDKPEVHKEFSVTEDTGVSVNISSGKKVVASFIAGKTGFTPSLGYIRKTGDNRVLEVYGNTANLFTARASNWLNTQLFTAKADDIKTLKIKNINETIELKRDESNWSFAGESTTQPDSRFVNQMVYYLTTLKFNNVVQKGNENLSTMGLDPPDWSIEAITAGGETVVLDIGKEKDKDNYYARANADNFVVTLKSNVAEILRSPKDVIISGKPTTQQPQQKSPHRTKYTVTGKGEPLPVVKMITNKGDMTIELWEDDAPNTVANFIYLAEMGFYEGLSFHRHEPGTVLQGGDPNGDGSGGPGWSIEAEVSDRKYDNGVLGMADSGVDTAGSQFFFSYSPMPQWDPRYTCFGRIINGMEIFQKLTKGDNIVRIEVLSKRNHEYRPFVHKKDTGKEEQLPPIKRAEAPKQTPKEPEPVELPGE